MFVIPRRDLLKYGAAVFAGLGVPPSFSIKSVELSDELLLHEVKTLEEIDNATWTMLWQNLQHVSEEELDWKVHPEANTLRWVVGHLNWFEAWAADAIEETGMYLDDQQGPDSFQARPFSAMKERFEAARKRYVSLTRALTPEGIKRDARFVYNKENDSRWETDIRRVLQIHTTHLAGHRYQVRYIRGTYSRAQKTDKARFDPW